MPTPDEIAFLFKMSQDPAFAQERAKRAAAFDPNRAWVDGSPRRLSDRVWDAKQWSRSQIDGLLKHAIATGEDALVTAKKLEQFLDPAYAPIRTTKGRLVRNQRRAIVTQAPGRGGSGSFPARRLARTEITRAHGQGTIDAAKATPFAQGVKWSLSGRHPKADVCNERATADVGLGPGVYPANAVPTYPTHPQDLCTLSVAMREDTDAIVDELRREFGLDEGAPPTEGGWAPSMSREEAERWNAGSSCSRPTFHVTNAENVTSITTDGFDLSRKKFGRVWGDGVYMTPEQDIVEHYLNVGTFSRSSDEPRAVLELRVKVNNVLTFNTKLDTKGETYIERLAATHPQGKRLIEINDEIEAFNAGLIQEAETRFPFPRGMNRFSSSPKADRIRDARGEILKQRNMAPKATAITKWAHEVGIDAIEIIDPEASIAAGGTQLVVFNPKHVVVVRS